MAKKDPATDPSLQRLGGGRWQTRDGRFAIEPMGGSWSVVDASQTDELGMPLVRGPYASLTAARAAIDAARGEEAPVSPLAARLDEARDRPAPAEAPPRRATGRRMAPKVAAKEAEPPASPEPPPPPPRPAAPPEPAWIGALPAARRREARALIARLEAAGVEEAEQVARAEVVDGVPAVVRLAIARRLATIVEGRGGGDALAAAVLDTLADGEDPALGVTWSLVDGTGRPVGRSGG